MTAAAATALLLAELVALSLVATAGVDLVLVIR